MVENIDILVGELCKLPGKTEWLKNRQFEEAVAMPDLTIQDALNLLHCEAYFDILQIPAPTRAEGYISPLTEENIISRQDNGLFSITNLGALLFAKELSVFPRLAGKAIRIVQYEGNNKVTILKEHTINEGYATGLEKAVDHVGLLLPSRESLDSVQRTTFRAIPLVSIREAIANSLIHQDFYCTGAGPIVELFDNKVEITNPGIPLIDIMRIVDNPPKSINEKMSSLMRRLKMCEELGSGWDRMVIVSESQQLPAPKIRIYQDSTKVSLFSRLKFANIPFEDKLWSVYLHACVKYIEGESLTNSSLRQRFGVKETSSGTMSRLIKEALRHKLIKPIDPGTAPRYMKYIPIWA